MMTPGTINLRQRLASSAARQDMEWTVAEWTVFLALAFGITLCTILAWAYWS